MTMQVDRDKVVRAFREYVSSYDASDGKIRLKIAHTHKVAALSEGVARSIALEGGDLDLAWLIGMLHDVGRFEQVRRCGTFFDAGSVDHADLGADLLFKEGLIDRFAPDCDPVVETAVRAHNKLALDPALGERDALFCNIVRDADKVDILRVNVETPLSEIYDTTPEAIRRSGISPEVEDVFYQHRCVPRALRKTVADCVVGHGCLCYELVFPFSVEEVLSQGFVFQLLSLPTDNPETAAKLGRMKLHLKEQLVARAGRIGPSSEEACQSAS